MSERIQIDLRGDDADRFREIHRKVPTETYVETVMKLLGFYKANSPHLKVVHGE